MKKIVALLMALCMVFALCACGQSAAPAATEAPAADAAATEAPAADATAASDLKVGFIFLHDENSTYDLNFMNGAKEACANLGLSDDQVIFRTNIPEGQECYDAAAELADAGCNVIFADSFGHEDFMIQAAKEFPEVQFCHATGTKAHTEGLANYHNAFASIYEGRYLAGVAAGLKLNEMIANGEFTEDEAKIGYVGAFTYAEVVSGYTSFFLGARSVCPTATMEVTFTGSWYDETAEKEGAQKLINNGCVLISQHADSKGAPTACETAGVPNVSYNGSTQSACPNTFLVSSRIDWEPYFEYAITAAMNGTAIDADWTGTLATGSVDKIVAAFRGDDHLVPDAHLLNGLPHKALRHAVIVGRRRVDEIHAAFHGGPDSVQPGILGIVIPAGAAHPPCTEGHFGNLQARASKCFITHSASSRVQRDF